MSLSIQDARILIKRSTTGGATPTAAPSNDHTDGTWSINDIYKGEFYSNITDEKIWFRHDANLKQIAQLPSAGLTDKRVPYSNGTSVFADSHLAYVDATIMECVTTKIFRTPTSMYIGKASTETGSLHFFAAGHANSVNITAPATLASGYGLVLPTAQGGATQALINDGSGNLSWSSVGTGTGTTNFVVRWTSANALGTGVIYDNGTNVGIGTTSPSYFVTIQKDINAFPYHVVIVNNNTGNQAASSLRINTDVNGMEFGVLNSGNTIYSTYGGANDAFLRYNPNVSYQGNVNFLLSPDAPTSKAFRFYISNTAISGYSFLVDKNGTVTNGFAGFNTSTPTARIHIAAGTATASTAPLKFTSGTNLAVVENGAVEYDGNYTYITDNGIRRQVLVLTSTGTNSDSIIYSSSGRAAVSTQFYVRTTGQPGIAINKSASPTYTTSSLEAATSWTPSAASQGNYLTNVVTGTAGAGSYNVGGCFTSLQASSFTATNTANQSYTGLESYVSTTGLGNTLNIENSLSYVLGNTSIRGTSFGTTVGINVGTFGEAANATTSIGAIGKAVTTKNSGKNIGGVFNALNAGTSPTIVGLFAGTVSATPTWTSSALLVDNGSHTHAIAMFRDNGTVVWNIADGGALTAADGSNIALGTSIGSILGTATDQKLGIWNATPIVQPTTAIAASTLVGGGGTTLTDTDTFDGYTLKQVVKALRNIGLLA